MNLHYQAKTVVPTPNDKCAIEECMPRIAQKMCLMWNTPELESYISHLIMDSRDGERQGLPWDVAEELLFLNDLSIAKRAIVAASITGVPYRQVFNSMRINSENVKHNPSASWDDPNHSSDSRKVSKPSVAMQARQTKLTQKAKPWWKKLLAL